MRIQKEKKNDTSLMTTIWIKKSNAFSTLIYQSWAHRYKKKYMSQKNTFLPLLYQFIEFPTAKF